MGPSNPSNNQGAAGDSRPGSRSLNSSTSPAAGGASTTAATAAMQNNPSVQNNNLNQQQVMEAMLRASSNNSAPQPGSTTPQAQQQQDQQQKQHQLLMAHMLQQHMGGNAATATTGGNATAGGTGAGGGEGGQGVVLEQRVKQFQVMQHLQQLQRQKPRSQQPQSQQQTQQMQGLMNNVGRQGGSNNEGNNRASTTAAAAAATAAPSTNAPNVVNGGKALSRRPSQRRAPRRKSHDLLGGVAPDPIADGAIPSQGSVPLVGSGGATNTNSSGKGNGKNKQSFLDGHFAGGWQSNADLPDRRRIIFSIIKVIERMRPDANRMSQNRLPLMAKKLEEHLYRSAHTREDYIDPASLKRRLHIIAKGVGLPKPDDGDDATVAPDDASVGQAEGGNVDAPAAASNRRAVPMEAMSRGPGNGGSTITNGSSNPQQRTNPPQDHYHQQQQQMLLLQQQQQQRQQQLQQMHQQQQIPQAQQANNTTQQQHSQSNDGQNINSISAQLQNTAHPGMPQDLAAAQENHLGNNQASDKKKVILLQQQRRLLLLRHASKCNGGPSCRTKFCSQMVTLWKHMKKCRDKHCKVSHCLSSRCVLNHYRICKGEGKTASCAICAPVMKHTVHKGADSAMGGGANGSDAASVDELETLAFNDGLDELDGTPGDDVGIGVCQVAGMRCSGMEALGAFMPVDDTDSLSSNLTPNPSIPQAQATAMGMPQSSQGQTNGGVQDIHQELQKKQLLLQQIEQQKGNLFGQSQKLQQQLMSAPNPQQAQQLRNQQTILQQLSQQFGQQQSILQGEIQRHSLVPLQQRGNQGVITSSSGTEEGSHNCNSNGMSEPKGSSNSSNSASKTAKASKRSSEVISTNDGQKKKSDKLSRPRKKSKEDNRQSIQRKDSGGKAAKSYAKQTESATTASNKKTFSGGASADKGDSLIPSLPPIPGAAPAIEQQITKKCLPLAKKLLHHEHGWVFKDPVDPVELGIPEYFDVVEHPMDLTLVVRKVEDGAYKDVASFVRDTKLVFENAILFNGEDSDVGDMAKELLDIFAEDIRMMQ